MVQKIQFIKLDSWSDFIKFSQFGCFDQIHLVGQFDQVSSDLPVKITKLTKSCTNAGSGSSQVGRLEKLVCLLVDDLPGVCGGDWLHWSSFEVADFPAAFLVFVMKHSRRW